MLVMIYSLGDVVVMASVVTATSSVRPPHRFLLFIHPFSNGFYCHCGVLLSYFTSGFAALKLFLF